VFGIVTPFIIHLKADFEGVWSACTRMEKQWRSLKLDPCFCRKQAKTFTLRQLQRPREKWSTQLFCPALVVFFRLTQQLANPGFPDRSGSI